MPASNKKAVKKGLGRGFASLIPTDLLDESFDPTASQDHQVSDLRQIKIDQISVDPNQPRKRFDQEEIDNLAASISEHGVLQPVIVTAHKGGYQIVAGERRYRASKMAGLTKIPALVRTLSGQHKLEVSLIENLQRTDLNVMETATAYLKLKDQFNLSLEQIGKRVGNASISAVSNRLRLLKLSTPVQDRLVKGELSEGQARPLIGLDVKLAEKTATRIVKEGWSVHKVEQFIVNLKKDKQDNKETKTKVAPYQKQQARIQKKLGLDVGIQTNSKGAGRITIKFKNESEFERLQKLLS